MRYVGRSRMAPAESSILELNSADVVWGSGNSADVVWGSGFRDGKSDFVL